jgi:hypothetical protein
LLCPAFINDKVRLVKRMEKKLSVEEMV